MVDPSGAGDLKPIEPSKTQKGEELGEGLPSGGDIEAALHTKVRTLGQLKAMLIKTLGHKEGVAVYNRFLKSMALLMLEQIQQSANAAKRATQQMRTSQS